MPEHEVTNEERIAFKRAELRRAQRLSGELAAEPEQPVVAQPLRAALEQLVAAAEELNLAGGTYADRGKPDRARWFHASKAAFTAGRIARAALAVEAVRPEPPALIDAAREVIRFYGTDRTWSLAYRTLLGSRIDDLEAAVEAVRPSSLREAYQQGFDDGRVRRPETEDDIDEER